jgi:pimeloyl-ACP methyl ester carboxylesterase
MDVMGWSWPADPARAHGYVYETVQYDSELGPMDAWLVPGTESTWAIYVHGKGVDLREGLRILPTLHEAGMPVMLINYRNDAGQPEDPSGIYHYGQTEWRDLEGAVEFATDAGAERVVLVGASTGGAVISSFLLESDLAKSVDAVVLDSPNLDFGQVVDVEASERSLPGIGLPVPATLTWTAKTIAAVQLGISWDDLDYVSRADEFEVPILVIHGTNDGTVPIETSRRLAEARPDLVTLVETDAGHVLSWNVGPAAYADAIEGFLGFP